MRRMEETLERRLSAAKNSLRAEIAACKARVLEWLEAERGERQQALEAEAEARTAALAEQLRVLRVAQEPSVDARPCPTGALEDGEALRAMTALRSRFDEERRARHEAVARVQARTDSAVAVSEALRSDVERLMEECAAERRTREEELSGLNDRLDKEVVLALEVLRNEVRRLGSHISAVQAATKQENDLEALPYDLLHDRPSPGEPRAARQNGAVSGSCGAGGV